MMTIIHRTIVFAAATATASADGKFYRVKRNYTVRIHSKCIHSSGFYVKNHKLIKNQIIHGVEDVEDGSTCFTFLRFSFYGTFSQKPKPDHQTRRFTLSEDMFESPSLKKSNTSITDFVNKIECIELKRMRYLFTDPNGEPIETEYMHTQTSQIFFLKKGYYSDTLYSVEYQRDGVEDYSPKSTLVGVEVGSIKRLDTVVKERWKVYNEEQQLFNGNRVSGDADGAQKNN